MLQVYMGDGKGKTTAAVGLAVRAAGQDMRVLFVQFMKGGASGEVSVLQKLPQVTVLRSEIDFPFFSKMTKLQKQQQTHIHNEMLQSVTEAAAMHRYDMIILDEITYPCQYALIDAMRVKQLITTVCDTIEVVCTGREPQQWMLDKADYITCMQAVRHPYERGVTARKGIEY